MASSDKDASCANDPDFAVICAFLEKFSEQLQVEYPDFKQLQEWLTNTDEVPNGLRDLHVKLMRKTRRTVHECAWETALSKFCFSYSSQDGWEIERFGYKKSSLKVKLRILRELLESQFDRNNKFRAKLQTMSADSLRSQPIGRDRLGHSYWLTQDLDCNLRIYQEHLDEEIWQVVATNREELVKLISRLKGNEVVLPSEIGVVDEDSSSNSCSAPIVKPPPPEEKDDSQESNQSAENRIPNIKIKLGSRESGIVVNGEASSNTTRDSEEKPKDNGAEKEVGKKVKPLVISHSKIALEKPKKRALDSDEKSEPEEVKKHRPTLLDSKREKKPSKYEKAKQEDDEDDENDDDDDDGDEEEDEEGEEEEDETGDDGEEDEEDDDDEEEGGEEEAEAEGDEEAADDEIEETDEKNDEVVSEAVEDPLILVKEDGNGEDCESGCYDLFSIGVPDTKPEFSEVIEEMTFFVTGEGAGAECLVGNAKTSESEPKATFFFGQPGCLKLSPVKTNQSKTDEVGNCKLNATETESKVTEPTNGENHSGEPEESSKSAEQEHSKVDQDPKEAKNGNQEESQSRISLMNRKRRLSEEKPEKPSRHTSESETEVNSEILEDQIPDIECPEDIGGKRPKMRSKLMNTEMRKKVEAQRKNATVEETTSSSGEEDRPRKKIFPKKVERDLPRMLPLKAKLKQAAAVEVGKCEMEKVGDSGLAEGKDVVGERLPAEIKAESFEGSVDTEKSAGKSVNEVREGAQTSAPPEVGEKLTDLTSVGKQENRASPTEEEKETIAKTEPKDPIAGVPDADESQNVSQKPEAVTETPADDHPVLENQRKRRSSEEDPPAKESIPPVEPPPLVKTRTGRRGGPPEPVPELPLPKRTRVKASVPSSQRSEEAGKKAEIDSSAKTKSTNRSTQNKPTIKEEDIKKEEPKVEKEAPVVEDNPLPAKVEPKIEDDAKPAKVSVKTPLPSRPRQQAAQKQPASGQRRKNHDDVDAKNIIDVESESTPVRQSRRIAQLKIREEAERRKMEEIALRNMKAELKKKKKAEKADDPTVSEPSEHSSDHADSEIEIKKKAEKKKKCPGKGGSWSSGSEEPEEEEEEQYETDPGSPLFKSDHEFSPESELEDESQVVPLKRARTARKEGEEIVTTAEADESCQKCGKSDHPEWILLCDKCDKGYHCSCLSPVIFYIPEGDWFCPPCQQVELIAALESHLKEFDDLVQRKKEEEEEKKRLEMQERMELEKAAQLKLEKRNKRKQNRTKKGAAASKNRTYRKKQLSDESGEESEENETETDASNSSKSNSSKSGSSRSKSESATDTDDEPIYKLRKRRQINVSYRLNEYDDMIKSALKEEEDEVAGAGNLGRGKDISTIIEADKEEKLRQQQAQVAEENGDPVEAAEKPANNIPGGEDSGSDFEPLKRKPKSGKHTKKKPRKLTTLDISSEGDNESDEDFKTSSMDDDEEDEEDEEEEDSQSSDSSLEVYRRRRQGKTSKKKTRRAARRAARERRKDRNFIVEDSDGSEEEDRGRSKKKRKKDSDYTESETNDDDDEDELSENIDSDELCDDSTESEASDGAWRPSKRKKQRSNTIARKSPKLKARAAPKAKKTKRVDDNTRSFKSGISKNRAIRDDSDDDDDSVDSSRKTRGKRCVYMEDFEDDSSDGGIKPGVKRPDTPPEEREKFIKKQEEIKRMLAEKNAEGAKLAATPRLVPIKSGAQRSPAKLDSLSTVPLSVIRQAKALDIDYLQRKGESISEGDLDESEFDDDDLPDDFNPEDMDEEAIARMVEEEDFAQQQLKLPSPAEVLRKKPAKEMEVISRPAPSPFAPQPLQPTSSSSSGLQEPVRKKLPMPTIHPPLLRHSYGGPPQHAMQHHRSSAPPHLPLLQTALSAPLNNQISRNFPPTTQAIPATTPGMGSHPPGGSASVGGDSNKPRGRRKKITPLRDTLQKQQAAAAASAAAAAASKPNAPPGKDESKSPAAPVAPGGAVATPGVIKSALSIAQPPQLYKPPPANTQPSVITRMPHLQGRQMMPVPGPPFPDQGSRFYRPPQPQSQHTQQPPSQPQTQPPPNPLIPGSRPPQIRHRGPLMPPMTGHHGLRPSYVGGPPPLRPSSGAPPMSVSNEVREQVPPRQSYPGPDPYTGGPPPARHSAPPHLSPYRSQMFGNPGFPQRGPPANSSQPSGIRPTGAPPEYSPAGSYVGAYTYYPPPLSVVSHSAPPPPTASAVPSSVIVSVSSLAGASSAVAAPPAPPSQPAAVGQQSRTQASSPSLIEKPCPPAAAPVPTTASSSSVIELSRKKLTTLETFNTCKTATPPPPLTESSESRSPYSSNPPTVGGIDEAPEDGSASPPISSQSTSEFSGLVSYFSSQHDDLNT